MQGDIQTLLIADRPDSAYEVCKTYAPNCINPQLVSKQSENKIKTSKSSSSSKREKSSKSRTVTSKKRASSDQAIGSNYRDRNTADISWNDRRFVESTSHRSFGESSVRESTIQSHDSGESDGLGIALNGEDDYYDSLTSGDERESTNSRSNKTRPLSPEPSYNPEPGIHDVEPPFNPEPGIHYPDIDIDQDAGGETSPNTTFSTIVNGVKIKSLPGPRGSYQSLEVFTDYKYNFNRDSRA